MYGLIYSSHLSANQELYLALFPGANELNGLAEIIYGGKFPIFALFAIEYQFVTANGVPANI